MADVQNWLTSRLTPANAQSERWTDLAKAVEAFWDQNFEPSMDAFERSRSVFTADDADITLKLAERGKKFEVALPITPSSMAMAYAMRSYEIHQKDHQDALEIVLQRDFGNVVIRWMPLKAPIALPYGELFITDVENQWIGIPESELWQTSRAKVLVDTSAALAFGLDRPAVAAALQRKLDELRPAHIVYDGMLFISWFPIEVAPVVPGAGPRISRARFATVDADPLLAFRLDDFRLDDFQLDWFSPLSLGRSQTGTHMAPARVPFRFPWRLDMGWEIGGHFRAIPGTEGDTVEPLYMLGAESETQDKIAVFPTDFSAGPVESTQVHLFETLGDVALERGTGSVTTLSSPFVSDLSPLADMPSLDDVPLDFAPLDLRYT